MTRTTKTATKTTPKATLKAPAKQAAPKGPTMDEILPAIKAAKHVTVYALVDGEKKFSEHPNLREAGIAAQAILRVKPGMTHCG